MMSYMGLNMLNRVTGWGQNTLKDQPEVSLDGIVAVVTGPQTEGGKETVRGLALRGARVILASKTEAEDADLELPNVRKIKCDLASFASVREFCRQVEKEERKVDILINNAAAFNTKRELTEDGQELVFQVNHLSHFLLTNLLMDKLKASKAARIINVSSVAHWSASLLPTEALGLTKSCGGYLGGVSVFALSQLSNILFTLELSHKLKGLFF